MKKRFLALAMSAVMTMSTVMTAGAETADRLSSSNPFVNTGDEKLTGDFDITYSFHTKSEMKENWDTFAIEFYSDAVSTGETGKGYLTLRADAWGWWAEGWADVPNQTDVNKNWQGIYDGCWDTWKTDVSDADVIINAKRLGDTISVQYDIKGTNGSSHMFTNSVENAAGFGDYVFVHLTMAQLEGVQVELTDIKFTVNQTDTEQTGTDAEQTGTDAEQTGTDAEQTGTDAEQTGTDAEQTGTDAEQTETDAEQTATDVLHSESGDDIHVEYNKDQFEGTVKLNTKQLDAEDEAYKEIDLTKFVKETTNIPDSIPFAAYDITLTDEDNQAVQPNGKVTVKVACPEEFKGSECKVYRVNNNGSLTNMMASFVDGYLSFETNHFSTYIVTEEDLFAGEGFVYGDVNGDGEINSKDTVLLKKYLAGFEDAIERLDQSAGDVTGDGSVTSADAVRLLKSLAGYDVELGR